MADLGTLSVKDFSGRVGESFRVEDGDAGHRELRLTEATSLGQAPAPGARAPFSIMFSGPVKELMPQSVHRLVHDDLGSLEIFLVPLQPQGGSARYQAIFS